MGFASVDPWMGKAACYELERSIKELGLKGLKLHPIHQAFFPNDTRFYPLYEVADGLGIPVLFHSGFAGAGSGTPGGSGLKLKYSKPVPCFDDVAADFPNMTIIMAHPAWPWIDEQIAVALHKSNVFLDLSGWMPRFIPEGLIRETNTRLQDKVMFGSDYPFIQPDNWLADFPEPADARPRDTQGAAGKRAAGAQYRGVAELPGTDGDSDGRLIFAYWLPTRRAVSVPPAEAVGTRRRSAATTAGATTAPPRAAVHDTAPSATDTAVS